MGGASRGREHAVDTDSCTAYSELYVGSRGVAELGRAPRALSSEVCRSPALPDWGYSKYSTPASTCIGERTVQ